MKIQPRRRMKAKYNPVPNAKERRHHERLMNLPCLACGGAGGVVHHVLTRHFEKRWRRDHEWVLPMDDNCHRALHACGNEREWCEFDPVNEAAMLRLESIQEGIL